jgi:signal transduction histidine kinase
MSDHIPATLGIEEPVNQLSKTDSTGVPSSSTAILDVVKSADDDTDLLLFTPNKTLWYDLFKNFPIGIIVWRRKNESFVLQSTSTTSSAASMMTQNTAAVDNIELDLPLLWYFQSINTIGCSLLHLENDESTLHNSKSLASLNFVQAVALAEVLERTHVSGESQSFSEILYDRWSSTTGMHLDPRERPAIATTQSVITFVLEGHGDLVFSTVLSKASLIYQIASLTHDMKQPLSGIYMMISMLEEAIKEASIEEGRSSGQVSSSTISLPQANPQLDYIDVIKREAQSLIYIIDSILDQAKGERMSLQIVLEDFSLHALVDNVIILLSGDAFVKGLEILSIVDVRLPRVVRGDASIVKRILLNLLQNAIKFTAHGEVLLRVSLCDTASHTGVDSGDSSSPNVKPRQLDYCIHFEVIDTGVGMSAPMQQHQQQQLLRPTQNISALSTQGTGGERGHGFGLKNANTLIMLIGGTGGLSINSHEREGTDNYDYFENQKKKIMTQLSLSLPQPNRNFNFI